MKKNIWVFSIESIETRYTCQWYDHIPSLLASRLPDFNVVNVAGVQRHTAPTEGAFLNFSDTNYWKSSQLCNFLDYLNSGATTVDDHFVFPDAWNPAVLQLKYISDLHGYNWKFHGLFHAGSWDPGDFLGRSSGGKPWAVSTERAMYHAYDRNYFATDFHQRMFSDYLFDEESQVSGKLVRTGWPMEYMQPLLVPYAALEKRNLILFPHRIAPEKQVGIFRDLAAALPEYEFVVCQDKQLTKEEYHNLLGAAKIVFSASLQETLGISVCAEAPLTNAVPMAPDRLSYSEIFTNYREFLYPSEWTSDWDAYLQHKQGIISRIVHTMQNYESLRTRLREYVDTDYPKFFSADELIRHFN